MMTINYAWIINIQGMQNEHELDNGFHYTHSTCVPKHKATTINCNDIYKHTGGLRCKAKNSQSHFFFVQTNEIRFYFIIKKTQGHLDPKKRVGKFSLVNPVEPQNRKKGEQPKHDHQPYYDDECSQQQIDNNGVQFFIAVLVSLG